ncbi:helix-turn-helix transcriptional regulator [Curtobacterium flaccumfaciens]|jgi:DNA-binding transcriptional ArsR family regulator|uniref:ArsR/SmtB family transcription factor n=1 Tax=Curtobacterium flaccumfaciens TaxID=2035 RepID=UPI00188D1966|nr:metalloregulator ArsR/SmtB family transcription factor [Curtobacterium flaccumfaciens]MBF4595755.1 helix-turn-helix transcriptional regulator [Curtobacterium flaccumfaciens]
MTPREDLESAAELFKVLASTSRLHLLCTIADGALTVSGLVKATGLSQPLASQHLRTLRAAGLVEVTRRGREAEYSLADAHVAHIVTDAVTHTHEGHLAHG